MSALRALAGPLLAFLRRARTRLAVMGKGRFLTHGPDLHVGAGTRLWAPSRLAIGRGVYIGKQVSIEANAVIGDWCLIANRAAFVGRHDHDHTKVGLPMRFAPWIGEAGYNPAWTQEEVRLEQDVWVGYGAIVLTGVRVGRGAIVAAGAVVTRDVPPYAIVAGSPARVVGERLAEHLRPAHEKAMAEGRFRMSERGREHFVIQPGPVPGDRP